MSSTIKTAKLIFLIINCKAEIYTKREGEVINKYCPKPKSFFFSNSTKSLKPKCIICNGFDEIINLQTAGDFHVTKTKLNVEHVTKQTEQWRQMALVVWDDGLASWLMSGDLGAS